MWTVECRVQRAEPRVPRVWFWGLLDDRANSGLYGTVGAAHAGARWRRPSDLPEREV